MAAMFVNAFDSGFDPTQFHDRYREALRELVDAKVAGQEVTKPAEVVADSNVIDLMEALRASVAAAEGKPAPPAKKAGATSTKKATKAPAKKAAKKAAPTSRKKAAAKPAAKKSAEAAKKPATKRAAKGTAKKTASRRKTA